MCDNVIFSSLSTPEWNPLVGQGHQSKIIYSKTCEHG